MFLYITVAVNSWHACTARITVCVCQLVSVSMTLLTLHAMSSSYQQLQCNKLALGKENGKLNLFSGVQAFLILPVYACRYIL